MRFLEAHGFNAFDDRHGLGCLHRAHSGIFLYPKIGDGI